MDMRVLKDMEVRVVGGGVCEEMSLAECFDDFGGQVVTEVSDFFVGLNQMGADFGVWFYNYTHGC